MYMYVHPLFEDVCIYIYIVLTKRMSNSLYKVVHIYYLFSYWGNAAHCIQVGLVEFHVGPQLLQGHFEPCGCETSGTTTAKHMVVGGFGNECFNSVNRQSWMIGEFFRATWCWMINIFKATISYRFPDENQCIEPIRAGRMYPTTSAEPSGRQQMSSTSRLPLQPS